MKVSFVLGIALLLIGLVLAAVGIMGVGAPDEAAGMAMSDAAVPVLSGLALAVGGLLLGLSMGNWRHPRSHVEPGDEWVNPEGHQKMKHV